MSRTYRRFDPKSIENGFESDGKSIGNRSGGIDKVDKLIGARVKMNSDYHNVERVNFDEFRSQLKRQTRDEWKRLREQLDRLKSASAYITSSRP